MPSNNVSTSSAQAMAAANKAASAGKAYQAVAQSAGITIQDATDSLRNVQTMSNTARGAALGQLLATEDVATFTAVTTAIATMETACIANYTAIGAAASGVLAGFPSS